MSWATRFRRLYAAWCGCGPGAFLRPPAPYDCLAHRMPPVSAHRRRRAPRSVASVFGPHEIPVAWLVDRQISAARQLNRGEPTPAFVADRMGDRDAPGGQVRQ